jgi:hypothetical protein
MPLISMYDRDNSRTVYRMLSDKAIEQFDTPPKDDIDRLLFKSLARLLEHYRYDSFADRDPIGVLDAVHPGLRPRRAGALGHGANFSEVRGALETARQSVFGHEPRDQVVEFLQGVLARFIKGPAQEAMASESERNRAKQFFTAFSERLRNNR